MITIAGFKFKPEPLILAGHTFLIFHDKCDCGKHILDLMPMTEADLHTSGWAHSGLLTPFEFASVEAYKERMLSAARG